MLANFEDTQVLYKRDVLRKDVNLTVPQTGRWGRLRWDFELAKYENKPRQLGPSWGGQKKAMPQMVLGTRMFYDSGDGKGYRLRDYVPVPDAWQLWMKEMWDASTDNLIPEGNFIRFYTKMTNTGIFSEYTDGSALWRYVNMIEKSRAWTDSYAAENGARDVVTLRNMNSLRNWEWLCIPTGGNLVEILGSWGEYWLVRALDMTKPPPPVQSVLYNPGLIHYATQITVDEIDMPAGAPRRWVVSEFPQNKNCCDLNGFLRTGTPYPFVSLGGVIRVPKFYVQELMNGQNWSMYYPPK